LQKTAIDINVQVTLAFFYLLEASGIHFRITTQLLDFSLQAVQSHNQVNQSLAFNQALQAFNPLPVR
jgi:hypothetical protein